MRPSGPHFFVRAGALAGDRVVLTDEQARHLVTVLRARVGDPVSLADGAGALAQARVVATGSETTLDVVQCWQVPPPRPRLTVVHALPKGRKLDEVVQRLSEVGADRLVPVHSSRSQVRLVADKASRALARWRSVALAAGKQARRVRLLQVEPVGDWETAFAGEGYGAVLWEEATEGLSTVLDSADAEEVVLGVGPEGGLSAGEVAATGLPAASLGPTVLRTETAALVGAAVVLDRCGRLA